MSVFGRLNKPATLILGLGISGLSMARWCARHGCRLRIADTRTAPPGLPQLRAEGLDAECTPGALTPALLDNGIELVALSPGLSPRAPENSPLLDTARARGIPVWGELEFFAQALRAPEIKGSTPFKVIAITGTNGKTTTAALTGLLCERAGYHTCVAGNIGMALLDALSAAMDHSGMPDVWVLELSSFQLESSWTFTPDVATVLNMTVDHLDWHGDFEAYAAAKGRIFGAAPVRVLNRDDAHSMQFALENADRTAFRLLTFGLNAPQRAGEYGVISHNQEGMGWLAAVEQHTDTQSKPAHTRHHALTDASSGITMRRLMPTSDLAIRGQHNVSNALAALALCRAIGAPLAPLLQGLRDYRGEPHRFQYIARIQGVDFIDDSKGTNVVATLAALNGTEAQRIVLIAGGVGKGQNFSPLAEPVARVCRAVMLIGRDAPLLRVALEPSGAPLAEYPTLEAATRAAAEIAETGDAVLLSPACASFDMFQDYQHRAAVFRATVETLARACEAARS